jgi:hypothetical protein
MAMKIDLKHIEFKKQEIPVSKMIEIDGNLYFLEIQYNEVKDFYVAILYDDNETPLISSKLVYLGNAFHARSNDIPERQLIPMNLNDMHNVQPGKLFSKVSKEFFENEIKIYII